MKGRAFRRVAAGLIVMSVYAGHTMVFNSQSFSNIAFAQKTIVLVRHAEKSAEQARDPELTEAGVARAETLADLLENMGVSHVISSQFKRSQHTAAPTAERNGLEMEVIGAGTGAEALAAVVDAVDRRAVTETILIVGHSNTIPRLVTALGGPELEDMSEKDYDSIFILQHGPDGSDGTEATIKMTRLRYGVPNE